MKGSGETAAAGGDHTAMSLQDTERGSSGRQCSRTALRENDVLSLLKELADLKRKERENDPEVQRVKRKYKLKPSMYPSPGNILHTGRQLPRSPGPGILPLLPSQKFEPRVDGNESFDELLIPFPVKGVDNMVPSGRQLARTPLSTKSATCNVLKEIQANTMEGGFVRSAQKAERIVNNNTSKGDLKSNKDAERESLHSRVSDTMQDLENGTPAGEVNAHKEPITGEVNVCSRPTPANRRISELPVQGFKQMRISGVLKKMPGYECRTEDLEFLKHMENQERAKVLKAELLSLRKNIAATIQNKELIIAKKDKIEDDIHKMTLSFERTVQLGRTFLNRMQDPACVRDMASEVVIKRLNAMTIHNVCQQERAQLVATRKEITRREHEAANITSHKEDKKRLRASKMESYEQRIKETQCRIQQMNEEAVTLKTQIEETEKKKSEVEVRVQERRLQISQCFQEPKQPRAISENEEEKMKRRLQRILYRKDLYLERERIIQKLKRDLK